MEGAAAVDEHALSVAGADAVAAVAVAAVAVVAVAVAAVAVVAVAEFEEVVIIYLAPPVIFSTTPRLPL